MFRSLLRSAALSGIVAGLLLTALQAWSVAPLIRDAERVEQASAPVAPAPHPEERPASGGARLAATGIANVVLATGFALMLAGAMTLRGARGLRAGLLFGAAGYAVFFVAPSLGLPPTLPGGAEAPLAARTAWWVLAVACSVAGLALVALGGRWRWRALGVALLVLPHAIGAPRAPVADPNAATELAAAFARNAYLANALFWLVLGALAGSLRARDLTPPSGAP
jgi:cobalt transporter subunit CbtA